MSALYVRLYDWQTLSVNSCTTYNAVGGSWPLHPVFRTFFVCIEGSTTNYQSTLVPDLTRREILDRYILYSERMSELYEDINGAREGPGKLALLEQKYELYKGTNTDTRCLQGYSRRVICFLILTSDACQATLGATSWSPFLVSLPRYYRRIFSNTNTASFTNVGVCDLNVCGLKAY